MSGINLFFLKSIVSGPGQNFFAKIILGSNEILYLGNLNAKRDWGHAKYYT